MTAIEFFVYGVPQPQAGTRTVPTAGGNRQISTGGKDLSSWRQEVATTARVIAVNRREQLVGAVRLVVVFTFVMPASRPAWARRQGWCYRTTTPDLDKLTRAIGDSLKAGGLLRDDALIAVTHVAKIEQVKAPYGARIGVELLRPLHDETRGWFPYAPDSVQFDRSFDEHLDPDHLIT